MSAKPDLFELSDALLAIVRARNELRKLNPDHLVEEFLTCVIGSSAGSDTTPPGSDTAIPSRRPTPTPATPSPSGGAPSVLHTEDHWWTAQDHDERWIRQWDVNESYDNTDPKSFK